MRMNASTTLKSDREYTMYLKVEWKHFAYFTKKYEE